MKGRELRYYEAGNRIKTFGTENAADYGPQSKALKHYANVSALLEEIRETAANQETALVSRAAQVDALGSDLLNIARTARNIEKKLPGFAAAYRMPENTSDRAILTHADSVLQILEEKQKDTDEVKSAKAAIRARFVEYEMSPDFVAHLRADRESIEETDDSNRIEALDGVKSTALLGILTGKLIEEIAELDTINRNKYSLQPEKLLAWLSASHVERAPRHDKKAQPTPPPTPAPAPNPTPSA